MDSDVFLSLAVALGLGLLVGLQRERAGSAIAGIRTFTILTLAGAIAGLLSLQAGGIVLAAGIVATGILAWVGNMIRTPSEKSPGVTTEAAMLAMFGIGAMTTLGYRAPAAALGAAVAVLLHAKPVLHRFTSKLGEHDMVAIMQFAVLTLIILPVVPDQQFGPFGVLNPRQIWLMVLLVVGVSLGGYVAYRLLGERRGTLVAGLIGGLISTTATTASFSRRAGANPSFARTATVAILLAGAVVYARVLTWIATAAPSHFANMSPPIWAMLALCGVCAVVAMMRGHSRTDGPMEAPSNPTELKSAFVFAGLYALVLLAVAAGRHYFGEQGLFVVAGISGLTDMDAISLSAARLAEQDQVQALVASRAILIAGAANGIVKLGIAVSLGGRTLAKSAGFRMSVPVAGAVLLAMLWR